MDTLLVFTNFPSRESALKLAEHLIRERLAACVNVLPQCTSVYRWQGVTEAAEEVPVLIKTPTSLYAQVEGAIRERHPYELPEIIAVPVVEGLAAYLDWVVAETCAPGAGP